MNPDHPQFVDRADTEHHLNVLAIFLTVDGEANEWHPGTWSVFIRLTGCRVGCTWCDTKYSWSIKQGELMAPEVIFDRVIDLGRGAGKVTITGGEPLEQDGKPLTDLIKMLHSTGYKVSIETAGTIQARHLANLGACLVFDFKLPSSGAKPPVMANYINLEERHVVKFVIASREDFEKSVEVARRLRVQAGCRARIVFSPCAPLVPPHQLFQWMKDDPVVVPWGISLNMQMHKYIFPDGFRDEEGSGDFYGRHAP